MMKNSLIALEDNWVDVLHKARRGQDLSEEQLAERSGLARDRLERALAGEFDAEALPHLSKALGLDGARLLALARGDYHPGDVNLPEGMAMFTTDWGGMQVHSYLAWDDETGEAVAFDTGADASEILDFLFRRGLRLGLVLLTHGHGDHLFDLDRLTEKTGSEAWIAGGEGVPGIPTFTAGKEFQVGALRIETRSTKGHAPDGITYVIHGLGQTVAVVGDALFAGSMGGPKVSYRDCLETNRREILTLSPETILCPGHGPLTTVELEREHNPFFGEW
jgi:glyoxylase-like metal-dependent hydrolase (beta-lactamase superfamily II)